MRNIKFFILFALTMGMSSLVMAQDNNATKPRCTFSSQYIHVGDNVVLTYDPTGSILENETDLKCVLYLFQNRMWQAYDVDISQREGHWEGAFTVPQGATLLVCKFTNGSELDGPGAVKTDWGWPSTYSSFILTDDNKCQPGSYVAWGQLRHRGSNNSLPGMLEDSTAAPIGDDVMLYWYNNEFRYFPSEQPTHFRSLAALLAIVKPGEKDQQLKDNIRHFIDDKSVKLTDQQLTDMYDVSKRMLTDTTLADIIYKREAKLYKHGILERDNAIQEVTNTIAKDRLEGMKVFDNFMKTYPTEKFRNANSWITELFYNKMFRSGIYTKIMLADDYSNLERYIHDIPYSELFTTHWHIADSPFSNGHATAEKVLPWSRLIINEFKQRERKEKEQLKYSPREWSDHVVASHAMAWKAHARILTAVGEYKEAMEYASQIFPYYKATETEFATMWIRLLKENGRADEVPGYIEQCVFANTTSQDMLDELKADFIRKNPQGGFDRYVASLQNQSKADAERQKILAELIDMPINLYELEKMGGGKVNMADLKGKVIFMDFWATWCAPCKASMEGGQMAVDRYKDDPDVAFFFIDTQETRKDYREAAKKFIKGKGYTLTVLWDKGEVGNHGEVYKDYARMLHTSGIPFKVIVDKKGHLRWSTCGYKGSPSGFADELQYVIDYLKNE